MVMVVVVYEKLKKKLVSTMSESNSDFIDTTPMFSLSDGTFLQHDCMICVLNTASLSTLVTALFTSKYFRSLALQCMFKGARFTRWDRSYTTAFYIMALRLGYGRKTIDSIMCMFDKTPILTVDGFIDDDTVRILSKDYNRTLSLEEGSKLVERRLSQPLRLY